MVHVRFQDTLPFRFPEWVAAAMMTHWGWQVLIYPEMFSANPAFAGMEAILPQEVWGGAALLLGLAGLGGLAVNGFWVATPFIRAVSAAGRGFLWLQVQFGLMASGLPTTGTSIYIGLVLLEGWSIYRAMGDARKAVA